MPDGGQGGSDGGEAFEPGVVLAGRYRMVTLLGWSDSGAVWQADDLILQTPVALKIIASSSPEVRERILSEVRMARRITHPAVCRVFDAGEADGRVFYSRELVNGEALASLLRRIGRLPSEKVLEIARQLYDGLAVMHAHGVVHGNLDATSILIDEDGLVRIIDFGGDAAPGVATEAGDLHAAALVLYQLLTGQSPFEGGATGRPVKPSAIVSDVDPSLEQAILQALHPHPSSRPSSATAMLTELTSPVRRTPGRSFAPWVAAAVVALLVGVPAVLLPLFEGELTPALTDQDVLVIADFMNTTGEPVFDGSLKVALSVALEQSPFLSVFPDDRVRETLQLMQHPGGEPVTRTVAREVARRERLKAVVSGSIATLGSNYVLALEAIDAETGDAMAREQVEVPDREEVLTALGAATSRLRIRLGESLMPGERFDVALPRATTPSLDALHAYALALDEGRANLRPEAIPHLQRALELDPDFAMAHALLSGVYVNTGRFGDAPAHARRAFELRDRVSERERFFISWRYHVDAEQSWERALSLAESWTVTYPREAFAFNSLGLASGAYGDHERAIEAFRQAIRLDARFLPPHPNLAGSLIALGRADEAEAQLRDASERGIRTTGLRRAAYVLAWMGGDTQRMASVLADTATTVDAAWTSIWEARAAAAAGRFQAAHDLFARGIADARQRGLLDFAGQWTMEDAESHAVAGQCETARQEMAGELANARDNFTLERASRTLALCGDGGRVPSLSATLRQRFPEATLTQRLQIPVIDAALAVQRGQPDRAVERLRPVEPFDRAPSAEFWPTYLRGQAHLQLKQAALAAGAFRDIVTHQGQAPTSPLYALAHLGLARAALQAGERDQARQAYARFLALWAGADPELPALVEAQREYSPIR